MIFKTAGDKSKPAILFFHAMGVTGDSSMPVAECLAPVSYTHIQGFAENLITKYNSY